MLKIWLLYIVFTFFMMIGVVFGHHKNEKYAFDNLYKYSIKKSENAVKFKSAIINNEISAVVEEQINKKKSKDGDYGMVSFILFEDGVIKIDQYKKSKYRNGYMPSHSVGKSLVSLVTGYAVCGGYIESINHKIDYPTVENTLYENQVLLDLLNMAAGDEHIIGQRYYHSDNAIKGKGLNVNTQPIKRVMKNILFLIFLFLMSCGTSIKQIEVKEISDVQFMGIEDNQIILKSELNLYNPNNKNLRASQVYSKIYFNAKFFGEFENLDKILLKKNNFTKINCLIKINTDALSLSMIYMSQFDLNFDGFVKINFPNKKFKFNLDYELDSKLLTEKFLNNL